MQDIALFIQNHWLLNVALFVILFLLIILELIAQKRNSAQLSPQQTVQLMNHNHAVIVDIRSNTLFAEGHIINAISLPLQELELKWKKLEKYKSKPIILTCLSDTEAPRAVTLLKKNGFSDVRILSGGLRAWQDANMPVIKE